MCIIFFFKQHIEILFYVLNLLQNNFEYKIKTENGIRTIYYE